MTLLPRNTLLGGLEIVEVWGYYDGPRLFLCRNKAEQLFIAIWVDEDDNGAEVWLYIAISIGRLQEIRAGRLPLRDALVNSETGVVFRAVNYPQGDSKVSIIPSNRVADDDLPLPDQRLDLPQTLRLPMPTITAASVDLALVASQARREVLSLTLYKGEPATREAPARGLGDILNSVQGFLDAAAQAISSEKPSITGPIPPDLLQQTRVSVVGTFPGSFGIQLASTDFVNLLGRSLLGDAIDQLLRLLTIGNDSEQLRKSLAALKARAASRYASFLRAVIECDTTLEVAWGSPTHNAIRSAEIQRTSAKEILEVVEEIETKLFDILQLEGVLIGLNVRRRTFELWDRAGENKYSGRVGDEATRDVEHATINENYVATLRQTLEIKPATLEEKPKWELVSLRRFSAEEKR